MRKRYLLIPLVLLALAAAVLLRPDLSVEALRPVYAPPPSQFVDLQGMSVHYRDEGSGPPLVLVHGTGASLHTWDGWAEALQASYRVIRLDLPAFGLTGPHPAHHYDVATYTALLQAFVEHLGLDRFALAGNSLGGAIAWHYALDHPGRLTALVLVDPAGYPAESPGPPPLVFRLAQTPLLAPVLTAFDPTYMVRQSLYDAYGDDTKVTPALVQRYADLSRRAGNREAFVARMQGDFGQDRFAELGALAVPTLLLWGEADTWTPFANAEDFAAQIPGAQLLTYPGVGHVPMEELPTQTAADTDAFLRPLLLGPPPAPAPGLPSPTPLP